MISLLKLPHLAQRACLQCLFYTLQAQKIACNIVLRPPHQTMERIASLRKASYLETYSSLMHSVCTLSAGGSWPRATCELFVSCNHFQSGEVVGLHTGKRIRCACRNLLCRYWRRQLHVRRHTPIEAFGHASFTCSGHTTTP